MKEELLSQPIFGWFIRHIDVVALDRRPAVSLKKLLVDSQAKADQGLPVVIFPKAPARGRGTRALPPGRRRHVREAEPARGARWHRQWRVLGSGLKGLKQGVITVAIQPAIQPGLDKRASSLRSRGIETSSLSLFEQAQIAG